MAEEDEDKQQQNLDEEREQIKLLQSETARKKEAYERMQQKSTALNAELNRRRQDLDDKKAEVENQETIDKGSAGKVNLGAKWEEAVSDFMRAEVKRLLQDRIPCMASDEEMQADDVAARGKDNAADQPDAPSGKRTVHDTVMVSYSNFTSEGKAEDFKVTFRIDKDITVQQLHEDACSYWGCSPHAFALCKLDAEDKPEKLDGELICQKDTVLDPGSMAHLYLINQLYFEKFQDNRVKMKKQQEDNANSAKDDGEMKLKTLRHGTGTATSEPFEESFVEALKPWPGVHMLLKYRHRSHDRRSNIIKFRDIVLFGILSIMSGLCIGFRNSINYDYINAGLKGMLVYGIDSETTQSGIPVVNFETMTRYEDIWDWLGGSFHFQIFDNRSSFRSYYTPVGFLRIRQQIAKERVGCARADFPHFAIRPCHFVETIPNYKQETKNLIFKPGTFFNYTPGEGMMEWPDPKIWEEAHDYDRNVYGYMQRYYDGSGYMHEYNLHENNITQSGLTLSANLEDLANTWVTPQTRMIAVELSVANFNLRGYMNMVFLIEISPGGGLKSSTSFLPFKVEGNYWDQVANVLDIFRAFIIYGYIFAIRVYFETKRKVSRSKSGLAYVFSVFGLLDASIIALFTDILYLRSIFEGNVPPVNSVGDGQYTYTATAYVLKELDIMEGMLSLLVIVRWATFMRINSHVFRFWKTFAKSCMVFLYFSAIFVPVLLGLVFLGSTIWSPYYYGYATWTECLTSTLSQLRHQIDVYALYQANREWTLPYMIYFFFSMTAFFMNVFLAIATYAYFEVELLDGAKVEGTTDEWTWDQWLDWMLYGRVYRWLTGNEPGSSKIVEEEEDNAEEFEEEDEDE